MISVSTIVNGVLLGGLYAVIALGLSLIFGVMRLVNLAHGVFVIGGGYLSYLVTTHLGLDPLVSLVLVAPALFAAGYVAQRAVFTRLVLRGTEPAMVATFGLMLLGHGAYTVAFSSNPKTLSTGYSNTGFDALGVRLRLVDVVGLAFGIVLTLAVWVWLQKTRSGVAVRAAAIDPGAAETVGIDVARMYALAAGVAGALAAVAGVVVGIGYSFTPTGGIAYLTIGFTVVVLGGIGSVAGTFLAALVIGLAQAVGGAVFGPVYQLLCVYALFVILLAVRPQGLFARRAHT